MQIKGLKSDIIKPKDDILNAFIKVLKKNKIQLRNKDIIVISSKVLAVSEGRIAKVKSENFKTGDLKALILKEGRKLFPSDCCWLTLNYGHLTANAGIDRSNIMKEHVVLWPKNPKKSAELIQKALKKKYKLNDLGVIIADSACEPLRLGVHGISIGHYGFEGIEDCRNKKDIYGNEFQFTQRAIADSIATAALLEMGETNEKKPFAHIRGANVKFIHKAEIIKNIPLREDLFYGIYNNDFKRFVSKK
ncbi:coenzyme F420-0:L-glutamate ligase [Candidatus Peregrinibacteria bacterium]|nr:coenzyme F420-0:L-glutamate ligase [Candidatus Peregrinibacteria bacterium]